MSEFLPARRHSTGTGLLRPVLVAGAFFGICFALISVISDRARLQRELAEHNTALEQAKATILEMQVGDGSRRTVAQAGPRRFYAERRARWLQKRAHEGVRAGSPVKGASVAHPVASSESALLAKLRRDAVVITSPTCRASWMAEIMRAMDNPGPHMPPKPFAGGDLEAPGVMEAALAARAPERELIFLSVGDTRDHRREFKDPVNAS